MLVAVVVGRVLDAMEIVQCEVDLGAQEEEEKEVGEMGRFGSYLFQRAWRYLEVDFLGAKRLQQGDSVGAVMAVSVFPRVQQSVVVPRVFGKADVAVAVGRWKDPFQRGTSG